MIQPTHHVLALMHRSIPAAPMPPPPGLPPGWGHLSCQAGFPLRPVIGYYG